MTLFNIEKNKLGKQFLETSDHQDFNAKIEIHGFSNECSATCVKLSSNNFMEEIKPLITEN